MLKKIECFLQPSSLERIKNELVQKGVEGMSVSEIRGFGRQRGHLEGEKVNPGVKLLPKIKVEIVVDEDILDEVIHTVRTLCFSQHIGAGKIFVLPVEDAVRIRTAEAGMRAIH